MYIKSSFFISLSLSVISSVYQPQFLPVFGHCVSLLLAVAQHERSRSLRVEAMFALEAAAQCNRKRKENIFLLVPMSIFLLRCVRGIFRGWWFWRDFFSNFRSCSTCFLFPISFPLKPIFYYLYFKPIPYFLYFKLISHSFNLNLLLSSQTYFVIASTSSLFPISFHLKFV